LEEGEYRGLGSEAFLAEKGKREDRRETREGGVIY
jgi:hypothetical protein